MAVARGITVPFVGTPNQRGTGTGDERYVNCLFESVINPITKTQEVWCVKRPGLENSTQPPGAAATGRGLYSWGATGKLYSVFANKLYSGTTDLAMTLAGSSGRVWWAETPETAAARLLIASDGADNYNITTGDVSTQIDEADDADYPASNLGPVIYLDGYLLHGKAGQVVNGDLNSTTAWTAGNAYSLDADGDSLEAIYRQKDQILAFGKRSIEFLFNNGNPSGSPLLRTEQNIIDLGLSAKETLAWSGSNCCFVGEGMGDGGRAVWLIQEGRIRDVSNATINRFLAAEGTNVATASAWMERAAGQILYVLNLTGAGRSFVYNLDNNTWTEWEAAAGNAKFSGVAATSLNGSIYVQDAANGRVYTFPPTTYQDSGTNFTVTLQTTRRNYGTQRRKFETALELIGDTTTGTVTVEVSENDGSTFRTVGTIDMSQPSKKLHRLGSFRERIYRFTYAQNAAFRVQASRHYIETGET